MTPAEFYNHPLLIENFGKSRVFTVCKHLRQIWNEFPQGTQRINNYWLAWAVAILSKCQKYTINDVRKAVEELSILECGGQSFIVWFGDVLADPERCHEIKTVYVWYGDDNLIEVTQNTSVPGQLLLFQGSERARYVSRAAMLDGDFLYEMAQLIQPVVDENSNGNVIEEEGE